VGCGLWGGVKQRERRACVVVPYESGRSGVFGLNWGLNRQCGSDLSLQGKSKEEEEECSLYFLGR